MRLLQALLGHSRNTFSARAYVDERLRLGDKRS